MTSFAAVIARDPLFAYQLRTGARWAVAQPPKRKTEVKAKKGFTTSVFCFKLIVGSPEGCAERHPAAGLRAGACRCALAQIFRVGVDDLCQHGRLFCWVQPVPEPDRGRQDPQRAGRHQHRDFYGHETHRGMQDPPAGTFCSFAGRLPAGIYGCGHASCQHRHSFPGGSSWPRRNTG